jgi:NAD(P)-dependent dehydrogenase (short-subunit alcohol dehydrogenase family)
MGRAMARNLARAGHDVKAWYRSGGSVEGVTMVASPVEAFQGDAVLTVLSDDDAIRSTLIASGVSSGKRSEFIARAASVRERIGDAERGGYMNGLRDLIPIDQATNRICGVLIVFHGPPRLTTYAARFE